MKEIREKCLTAWQEREREQNPTKKDAADASAEDEAPLEVA
jgi:hypothetical protein